MLPFSFGIGTKSSLSIGAILRFLFGKDCKASSASLGKAPETVGAVGEALSFSTANLSAFARSLCKLVGPLTDQYLHL